MCTLIALYRCVPGRPLVIAANRDEYLDRPAEAPAIREGPQGRVLAPLDVRAGGTWLGLNGQGVFVALTNLRSAAPDPSRRSRGHVVMRALEEGDAEGATRALSELEKGAYNAFNVLVADARSAYMTVYDDAPRTIEMSPGVHVVGNVDAGGPANPKVRRIRAAAQKSAETRGGDVLERLGSICRQHDEGDSPLDDTCVHLNGTYGTRSSLLLELADDGSGGRLLYADGPPCKTGYEDFSSLLRALGQPPGRAVAEIM